MTIDEHLACLITIPPAPNCPTGHSGAVGSLAFSNDGRTLLTGSVDGAIRFFDLASAVHNRWAVMYSYESSFSVHDFKRRQALATGRSFTDTESDGNVREATMVLTLVVEDKEGVHLKTGEVGALPKGDDV